MLQGNVLPLSSGWPHLIEVGAEVIWRGSLSVLLDHFKGCGRSAPQKGKRGRSCTEPLVIEALKWDIWLFTDSHHLWVAHWSELTFNLISWHGRNPVNFFFLWSFYFAPLYSWQVDSSSIERVEEFKYLGTALTNQNSIQEEIKSRLKLGNACYYLVQCLFSSSLLSKNLKTKIYIEL